MQEHRPEDPHARINATLKKGGPTANGDLEPSS